VNDVRLDLMGYVRVLR